MEENQHERYFLYPDEDFPDYYVEELDCPFKSPSNLCLNIVGYCNGILCLSDDVFGYNHRAALWNPSVRKVAHIPRPNVTFMTHGPFMHSLGFGFDSITNDYMVVRIVYLEGKVLFDKVPPFVEVYSLKSGSWRMISNDLKYVIWERSRSAFVNGACHWLAYNPLKRGDASHVIVSLTLENELLREMAIPDCLGWEDCINMSVKVCDGMLSLVPSCTWSRKERYSVWVMKEHGASESWIKLFNIEYLEGVRGLVAFRKNDEVILLGKDKQLVSYDPKTKENWGCGIWGSLPFHRSDTFYLDTFVESLVLLSEASGISVDNDSGNDANSVQSKA